MVQVPFEVRVEGHEVEPSPDLDAPAVTKAEVADDVSAELRKHFARYPIAPTTRPRTTEPAPAQDFQLVLDNGVQRALRIPDLSCEALLAWAWQVVVVVPLGAFFVSLMTEAGKDAYLALKRLMHRLHTTAAHRQGSAPDIRTIELRDTDSGLIIDLPERLPDKAYRQLLAIKLPPPSKGYSLDRLSWFGGHWILQVRAPVRNCDKVDDGPRPRHSTVLVPLVWQARDRRWSLPPENDAGDRLFIE